MLELRIFFLELRQMYSYTGVKINPERCARLDFDKLFWKLVNCKKKNN